MGTIQFAKQFTQHFREVIIVADVGQEAFVCFFISFPVHSMQVGNIEFVIYLLANVVEDVCAFIIRTVIEECFKFYRCNFATGNLYFLQSATCAHKDILSFFIRYE